MSADGKFMLLLVAVISLVGMYRAAKGPTILLGAALIWWLYRAARRRR